MSNIEFQTKSFQTKSFQQKAVNKRRQQPQPPTRVARGRRVAERRAVREARGAQRALDVLDRRVAKVVLARERVERVGLGGRDDNRHAERARQRALAEQRGRVGVRGRALLPAR